MPESSSEIQQKDLGKANSFDANITPEGEMIRPVFYEPVKKVKETDGLDPLSGFDELGSYRQKSEGIVEVENATPKPEDPVEVESTAVKPEGDKAKKEDDENKKKRLDEAFADDSEEKKAPPSEFKLAAVATMGETNKEGVTITKKFGGKETKIDIVERQLQDVAATDFARRKTESDLAKEHKTFFHRLADFPRWMWRSMNRGDLENASGSYVKRDLHQGVELAKAGKTAMFTEQIMSQNEKDAAALVEAERQNLGAAARGWRRLRNFMSEVAGHETDEYRAMVTVMKEKREAFDGGKLDKNDPYYSYFELNEKSLEEVAVRISSGGMDSLVGGELKTEGIKIEKGTPVHKFYNDILYRISKDTLKRLENGEKVEGISPELRRQLEEELKQFYTSPEFRAFYKTLTPEQQAAFANSLTYSTDMLVNAEKYFIPAVIDSQDYYKSVEALDMQIELSLGTAKFGPNGEIVSEKVNKRSLEIKNQLAEQFGNIGAGALFKSEDIDLGIQRANMFDTLSGVLTSAPAWMAYGYLLTNVASSVLKTTSGVFAPLTGAIFGGVRSGLREYGAIRTQFSEMEVSGGYGLVRNETGRAAKRSVEISRREHQRISMGDRSLEINTLLEDVKNPESKDQAMRLLAITADSDARRRLGDANNINLLRADYKQGGEANEILRYQQEKRNHDEAVVKGKMALYDHYKGNRGDFNTLAKNLGVTINENGDLSKEDFDKVYNSIRQHQESHLYNATTIDPKYQSVLSSVTNKGFSISESRREKENFRRRAAITNGLTTAAVVGVLSFGAQAWAHHHAEIVAQGHEPATSQGGELLSNHSSGIPGMPGVTDAHGVVHNFQASLPEGTSFTHNADGTYSLFDSSHHELLSGIKISENGGILNIDDLNAQASSRGLHMIIGNQQGPGFEVPAGIHTVPGTEGHWEISSVKDMVEIRPGEKDGGLSQILLEGHPGMRNPVLNLMKNFGRGMDKDGMVNWHIDTSKGDYGHTVKELTTMFGNEHFVGAQAIDSVALVPKAYLDSAENVGVLYGIAEKYVDHGIVPTVGGLPQFAQEYLKEGHSMDELLSGLSGMVSSGRGNEENVMDAYAFMKDMFIDTKTWIPGTPGASEALTNLMSQEIPFVRLFDNPDVIVPFTPVIPFLPLEWHPGLIRPKWFDQIVEEHENPYRYISHMETPNPDEVKFLKSRLSKTLIENPKAKLDDRFEIKEYLNKQEDSHKKEIEKYKKQLGSMSPDVKLSVMIPVADHQEGKNIYRSLESYVGQTADKSNFEVVLFLNHPEFDKDGKPTKLDNTMEEVERFRKNHPEMNIRVMNAVLSKDKANIGYIRKALSDTILSRQLDRYESSSDLGKIKQLIIASNDADNLGIVPEYIQNFIDKFESDPSADAMLGQIDWDIESYVKFPAVHIGTRLFQYRDMQYRHGGDRFQTSGANFAYTSSIYAAAGGYVPAGVRGKGHEKMGTIGEDVVFGKAIRIGRSSADTIKFAGVRKSRLYTSARRAIYVLKRHGAAPIDQWGHDFGPHDDEVRKFLLGQENDIDYDNPKVAENVIKEIERVINNTIYLSTEKEEYVRLEPNKVKREEIDKRALALLGIEYKLVKEIVKDKEVTRIVITNPDKMISDLKHFKKIGILKKKIILKQGTDQEIEQMRIRLKELEDQNRQAAP